MASDSAWEQTQSRPSAPAFWTSATGGSSQTPRQGLRSQVAPSLDAPAGPNSCSSVAHSSSAPFARHAMSSHTCTTVGARRSVENIA